MTAIDQWVLELDQNRISTNPQPLTSTVDSAVAAILLLGTAVTPAPVAANLFYLGPPSGGALAPTFRVPVTADLPTNFGANIGNIGVNSTPRPQNGMCINTANNLMFSANSFDMVGLDSGSGLSMVRGSIVPLSTNGIKGTTTNDNANAGAVGEFITANGSGVALTTAVAANIASVSLTAGDWDVWGMAAFAPVGATFTQAGSACGSVSAGFPSVVQGGFGQICTALAGGSTTGLPTPVYRFSLSATTTIFLTAFATFSAGTISGSGIINARRVR